MDEFPMRINKAVARLGYTTRRGADELIEAGKVTVNGKRAKLGDKVRKEDKIEVKGAKRKFRYFAYNKPRGVITHSAQLGEQEAVESAGIEGVFPIGRLDKDSHGLLILTDDGRVTDKLLNPEYEHEKEYKVTTNEPLPNFLERKFGEGLMIEGEQTRPAKVRVIGENKFFVTLTEGKKHQVRRMCAALHLTVKDLERTRIMGIRIGQVPKNGHRPIEGLELVKFLHSLGIKQ